MRSGRRRPAALPCWAGTSRIPSPARFPWSATAPAATLTFDMLRMAHRSIPGNPLLAGPLYLAEYIERLGTGTVDMIRRCAGAGLPEPEFTAAAGFVTTIRRLPPAARAGAGERGRTAAERETRPERAEAGPGRTPAAVRPPFARNVSRGFQESVSAGVRIVADGADRFRVLTPFRFDDGDHLVIVLKKDGGAGWVLSDEAHTFMHLAQDGDEPICMRARARRSFPASCPGSGSRTAAGSWWRPCRTTAAGMRSAPSSRR